ncbi:protein CASC5 [Stegastes partitus]|uniref:Protein CASC5 n=1 Tax=Stegastes partitus TaxID=144197 RepID=A0A9Y4JSN6_9TELE|nr:PREDICTED: protein CASC5 [Stegastes partitus]
MEPLDPTKNLEGSGFSKRRISSILKAPRKSTRFPDPEQQENVVECAKPVEKRNSRRVSFAPANDVLLFSKDAKNASPGQTPLQELGTAAADTTQNRIQAAVTDDGSQQILGMETLLKAPLHTSQQKVNFDTMDDFGEKTVMFSTEDAFMDMTHSHTINIASDSEILGDISLQNYGILPTGKEKRGMITVGDGFTDMTLSHTVNMTSGSLTASRNMSLSEEKRNVSASLPCMDPGFENFLASLSKPSGPSINVTRMAASDGTSSGEASSSLAQIKTQRADVDKENQAPTCVSAVLEKSLNNSRRIRESFYGSALCPKDDVTMDLTEAQTGRILGVNDDDDDPFQCLFPTQDMYAHFDKRVSPTAERMKTNQQQSSRTWGSADPKDKKPLMNYLPHAPHATHKVSSDAKPECREKTIVFTADELMDMTQSHTVNIASGSFAPDQTSASSFEPGFNNFLASLSKPSDPSSDPVSARMTPTAALSSAETTNTIGSLSQLKTPRAEVDKEYMSLSTICPEDDVSMDMTEAQTGRIIGGIGLEDPFQFLFPSQGIFPHCDSLKSPDIPPGQRSSEASNYKGMETSLKPSLKAEVQRHQDKLDTEDDYREKTVRFSADDACMDVTQSHTVNIATNFKLQSHQNMDFLPPCGEKTLRFTTNDAAMDLTQCLTVNIASNLASNPSLPLKKQEAETFGPLRNRSSSAHSLNPASNNVLPPLSKPSDPSVSNVVARMMPNAATFSSRGTISSEDDINMDLTEAQIGCILENDVFMDMTETQTGRNIETLGTGDPLKCLFPNKDMYPQSGNLKQAETTSSQQNTEAPGPSNCKGMVTSFKPSLKTEMQIHQKTVMFSVNDAAMDVTRSHTVNIATDLNLLSRHSVESLPANGEKTVRFTANEAVMDVTRIHTVNIATDFEPKSHQNVDFLPSNGEKTVRFTANDATMDMTHCHTVNIASSAASESVLPQHVLLPEQNMGFPSAVKERKSKTALQGNRLSVQALDRDLNKSQLKTSEPSANSKGEATDAGFSQEAVDSVGFLVHLETQKPDMYNENEAPGLVSALTEKPVNKRMTDCLQMNASMDMTEAQTGYILEQTCTDESPQFLSSSQDRNSELLKKTKVTSPRSKEESSNPDDVEITKLTHSLDSNETETKKEPEPSAAACSLSQKMESSPSAADQDADMLCSRKSRRKSLADLQSKVRRLSHMINAVPDVAAIDSCTAPLPELDQDLDKKSKDKTIPLPELEPEPEPEPVVEMNLVNTEEKAQAQCLTQEEQSSASATTTPFKLKTQQLMSRLSVGGFKPKLPQRSKPDDTKKGSSAGEHTRTITVNVTHHMSNFDNDVSDIYDEELGSYEDVSETLDTRSPEKTPEKESSSHEFNMVEPLEEDMFEEDVMSTSHGQKRPLPEDENDMEDEKRLKASPETAEMVLQSDVAECESNVTTAYSNNSHTASSRCEAASESTFKHSLFESQLEDYASDAQKKLEDGTITVLEFFKLFNIDFVIHNPRQSVLPGRLLSDTDATSMDLLKDRHISRPKQMVYEADVLTLTEEVERLKVRMWDLDKPLKTVNRPLWEEMKYSSEKELKCFGAKLKERNNFFRKTSKVQSHEMKEVLYSNLVQANLEEQQKLRGTIEQADEMIKSLDDCIRELETELSAVEEKGLEDKPSLNSLQNEMKKVTDTLASNERQISELEMEKKQYSSKLGRLKAETRNLESHIAALNTLNEWRIKERKDNGTIYTFLHETMHLQLVYEKTNGNDAEYGSERKIAHIAVKFELDDEKSQCHARIVHKLLSKYIEGESALVEKYPTSRHVPKLLHDISLVVSRCRLLGDELRLLKMWGGLRLDILDISCMDTQVHIVFSSLKTFSKFEVVFVASLINQLCVLQVESFKNIIGSTTIKHVEDIVASFTPAKNLLTKIVKKIHDTLLC